MHGHLLPFDLVRHVEEITGVEPDLDRVTPVIDADLFRRIAAVGRLDRERQRLRSDGEFHRSSTFIDNRRYPIHRRPEIGVGNLHHPAIGFWNDAVEVGIGAVRQLGDQRQGSDGEPGFRIEDAKLNNIGPARCAVLRSWGIDTAADVDEAKISEIPGFGKNLTDKLVIWREMKEKAFSPNIAAIIDPLEVQRIDRQLAARRTKLMKELREKIAEVEQRMSGYLNDRAALWAQVEAAYANRFIATRP